MLATAAREPTTFVLGLDASAAAMAEASRRAVRNVRKGGLPNAAFVLAAAETPPPELRAIAELVTVRFPWGSLLRGCVGLDDAVAGGLAALVAPGGRLELLLAPADRDRLDGIPTDVPDVVVAVARAFGRLGLELEFGRPATPVDVKVSGSTWARRLFATPRAQRDVTLVRLARRVARPARRGEPRGLSLAASASRRPDPQGRARQRLPPPR